MFNLDTGLDFGQVKPNTVHYGSEDSYYESFGSVSSGGSSSDTNTDSDIDEDNCLDTNTSSASVVGTTSDTDDVAVNTTSDTDISPAVAKGTTSDEELLYENREVSRIAGFSYETDPVQKQFGEFDGVEYPCVLITSAPENFKAHLVSLLHNLVNRETDVFKYPIYMRYGDQTIELGVIDGRSLRILILDKGFQDWSIYVFDEDGTRYDDEMRLAFCSAL